MPDIIRDAVLTHLRVGHSVIPVDPKSKKPKTREWEGFQRCPMTVEDAERFFKNGNGEGYALVCGAVSNNAEVVDVDDRRGDFKERWQAAVEKRAPGLIYKLAVQQTQHDGRHAGYSCPSITIPGNLALAHKAVKVSGAGEHDFDGKKLKAVPVGDEWYIFPVMIETRGEGGYVLVAPTPGYHAIQGSFDQLPVITAEERNIIIEEAQALDERAALISKPEYATERQPRYGQVLPGDDLINKVSVSAILKKKGWKPCSEVKEHAGGKKQFWTRPGKDFGISATVFDDRSIYVFTSNAYPLMINESYSAFGLLAMYEYGGDYGAAAAALRERGFGDEQKQEDLAAIIANISWEGTTPKPLPVQDYTVPKLPPEMCPKPLRDWWFDQSDLTQIPVEYIAAASIVVLSSSIGLRLAITPKRMDTSWLVVPNLWGAIVGRPSRMKSTATSFAAAPLLEIEKEAREHLEQERIANTIEGETLEAQIANAKSELRRAAKGGDSGEILGAKELLKNLMEEKEDWERRSKGIRYTAADATTEAIAELLRYQDKGLLVIRDEITGLLKSFEKQGRQEDRTFYIESWEGTNSRPVDRISRGNIYVPRMCLSLLGTMQPAKLEAYIAETGGGGADGLMQRFQVVVWPEDPEEDWRVNDRAINKDAYDAACEIHRKIINLNPEEFGAIEHRGIPCISFSDEALELHREWWTELENRLLRDPFIRKHKAFEEHLGKYRSLMPSLALIFHLVDCMDTGRRGPITVEAAEMAANWCGFLELHAIKMYGQEIDKSTKSAKALIDRIERGYLDDGVTVREIRRNQWTDLTKHELLEEGLEKLQELGWLKLIQQPRGQKIVILNPCLKES